MIDALDKKMLESKFADDFASPYYPMLAELYLNEGDVSRARKVCEIGLDHDSHNIDGKFVFAKVALTEKKFTIAEKWLKIVVEENPAHFNGLRMLIKLEFQLSRSHKTIQNYINHLLRFLPDDPECIEWLNHIQGLEVANAPTIPTKPVKINQENNLSQQKPEPIKEKIYKIKKEMATLTMAQVLRAQRHYREALAVLDVLELDDQNNGNVARQKEEILELISESQK